MKIYKFTDGRVVQEVHMMGDYVGVVMFPGETGASYIDFVQVVKNEKTGKVWIDDDPTVAGGLSVEQAQVVAQELLAAIEYWKSQNL